ncbi:hypothetical protein V6N13_125603 [Hibiscus sabdariffa]|uniref:Uncharacterized protein n=1 Tax=Hibiscus sabdariffa TaxID=183260 RepID=A0ABR2U6W4_9ROSI
MMSQGNLSLQGRRVNLQNDVERIDLFKLSKEKVDISNAIVSEGESSTSPRSDKSMSQMTPFDEATDLQLSKISADLTRSTLCPFSISQLSKEQVLL